MSGKGPLLLALSQMRSGPQKRACSRGPWGYLTTTSRTTRGVHLATLRHFDKKVRGMVEIGPLIPCERRLRILEFSEFQEPTSGARFGNRDYDRPFREKAVTISGFD